MAQQRARLEARRKRLAEQKKKEQAKVKKQKEQKSQKKAAPAKRPLLSKDAPLTGDAAKKRLGIQPKGKAGTPAGKVPAPAAKPAKPAKPVKPVKPAKPAASNKGKERFFAGGKGGKYDKPMPVSQLKMSEHPGLKQNQNSKKTKLGATKTVRGQAYYYDGSKWVKGKLGKTTRLK